MIWLKSALKVIALLLCLGLVVVLGMGWWWSRSLPDYRALETLKLGSTTQLYSRDGQFLGKLVPTLPNGQRLNRTLVTYQQVSPFLRQAIITSEDRRFYEHHGVDTIGMARSLFKALSGSRLEGGSTLTNQVIKNTLLADFQGARTPERKFKEWMLSVQVERSFSKNEILQYYLNIVYWGSGGSADIIGANAAARAYFGKNPQDLTLAESVYLTNLIPSPRRYFYFAEYRNLMKNLLKRMVENKYITPAQAEAAWLERIQPKGWQIQYDAKGNVIKAVLVNRKAKNIKPQLSRAPYFMQQLEKELVNTVGREVLYQQGGLKVYTTLDLQAQTASEQAALNANIPSNATLGAVILNTQAEVLAMVGQKLPSFSEWNNAAQSRRQVGSTIKPLVYTSALATGLEQSHTEDDTPINLPCSTCKGGSYQPQNYSRTYTGQAISLRESLDQSLNLPTLHLARNIGQNKIDQNLRELGLTVPANGGLSTSIGALEASPLQMAAAYLPFISGGIWKQPHYIRSIQDQTGRTLYSTQANGVVSKRVWDEKTAFLGLDMLRGVVYDLGNKSLASRARIAGRDLGGKTGTSNDIRDLWFVGVTPELVGAVWVGKQAGGVLPNTSYSGQISAPIWREMIAGSLAGRKAGRFTAPDGITWTNFKGYTMAIRANQTATLPSEPEPEPTPEPTPEVLPSAPDDSVMVDFDICTGYLATSSTNSGCLEQRRIAKNELPYYQPPQPELEPDPNFTDPTFPETNTPDTNNPNTDNPDVGTPNNTEMIRVDMDTCTGFLATANTSSDCLSVQDIPRADLDRYQPPPDQLPSEAPIISPVDPNNSSNTETPVPTDSNTNIDILPSEYIPAQDSNAP